MRTSAGLIFMLGVLAIGLSILAGGQLWALSGSLVVGGLAGVGSLFLLALAMRWLLGRARANLQISLLGERRDGPDLGDFTEAATDDTLRETIARGVDDQPDRVAASVRSLLSRHGNGAS